MTGTEIYKRTATYDKESREIRLHAPEWRLLLAFDAQRTLSEAALSAEHSFADAVPLTQKFLDKKWIAEEPITLEQFLKRTGARDIATGGASVAPAVVLHEPKKMDLAPAPSLPVTARAPAPPPALVLPPVPADAPHSPPPLPAMAGGAATATAIAPALTTKAGPKSSRGPMKLSAVVDFITSLVGNISLGQLLVYRVFLRVPPDLLLNEDIASVHLANDTSVILGEKLQKAIADATSAVTKRALPDSVYAAV